MFPGRPLPSQKGTRVGNCLVHKVVNLRCLSLSLASLLTAIPAAFPQNWIPSDAPTSAWSSLASSSNGTILVAAANADSFGDSGRIYVSTNSGTNWTMTPAPAATWRAVSASSDGSRLAAVQLADESGNAGSIYLSASQGAAWALSSAPFAYWQCIASSANGARLLAGSSYDSDANPGRLYLSTDFGASWNPVNLPGNN